MPRKKKEVAPQKTARSKAKPAARKPKSSSKPKAAVKTSATKTRSAAKPKTARKAKPGLAARKAPVGKSLSAKSSWKPAKFGETQVVAFIRDPNCLFVYWEIAAQKLEQLKKELKGEYAESRLVLRMFRTRNDGQADLIYEIEVDPRDMNRYLPIHESGGGYFIEVARKTASGKVLILARSNILQAPTRGFSPETDPEWEPSPRIEQYLAEELEVGPENLSKPEALGGVSSAGAQEARRRKALEVFSSFGRRN